MLWNLESSVDQCERLIITYHYISDIDIFQIGERCCLLKTLKTFVDNCEGNLSILSTDTHRIIVGSAKGVIRMWDTATSTSTKPRWEVSADPSSSRHESGGVVHLSLLDQSSFAAITRRGVVSFWDFNPSSLTVKCFGNSPSPLLVHRYCIQIGTSVISGVSTSFRQPDHVILSLRNQDSLVCHLYSGNFMNATTKIIIIPAGPFNS